jgi:hypothetical protein
MFGGNRMNGVRGGRRVRAPALFLRACRQAAREHKQNRRYRAPLFSHYIHQNSAAGSGKMRKELRPDCYTGSVFQTKRLLVIDQGK